jgi:hypothetical protein
VKAFLSGLPSKYSKISSSHPLFPTFVDHNKLDSVSRDNYESVCNHISHSQPPLSFHKSCTEMWAYTFWKNNVRHTKNVEKMMQKQEG